MSLVFFHRLLWWGDFCSVRSGFSYLSPYMSFHSGGVGLYVIKYLVFLEGSRLAHVLPPQLVHSFLSNRSFISCTSLTTAAQILNQAHDILPIILFNSISILLRNSRNVIKRYILIHFRSAAPSSYSVASISSQTQIGFFYPDC